MKDDKLRKSKIQSLLLALFLKGTNVLNRFGQIKYKINAVFYLKGG